MSRTYRRKRARHEYRWVLVELTFESGNLKRIMLDRNSAEGRHAIARFHSDAQVTMKGGVPRWSCRIFKKRQDNVNARELRHWIADPDHDPVMTARHRHSAKWPWW